MRFHFNIGCCTVLGLVQQILQVWVNHYEKVFKEHDQDSDPGDQVEQPEREVNKEEINWRERFERLLGE